MTSKSKTNEKNERRRFFQSNRYKSNKYWHQLKVNQLDIDKFDRDRLLNVFRTNFSFCLKFLQSNFHFQLFRCSTSMFSIKFVEYCLDLSWQFDWISPFYFSTRVEQIRFANEIFDVDTQIVVTIRQNAKPMKTLLNIFYSFVVVVWWFIDFYNNEPFVRLSFLAVF